MGQRIVVDLEELHDCFSRHFKFAGIKHGDYLKIDSNSITVVEESVYINKNITNREVFQSEVREIVGKMWGSFAILIHYFMDEPDVLYQKERIFILKATVKDPVFARHLQRLMEEVKSFKDGAFDDIRLAKIDV